MTYNKRDALTDAQFDEILVILHTKQSIHEVARRYGMCWDTLRDALHAKRPEAYALVREWRIAGARKQPREPRPNIAPRRPRVARVLTEEELQEGLAGLQRGELDDAIAAGFGMSWSQCAKALKARFPGEYAAIMDQRSDAGKRKGGTSASHRKVWQAPAKKGRGFKFHLPGSGAQPLPNSMGHQSRWPVRRMAEFTAGEVGAIQTRLLGRLRMS